MIYGTIDRLDRFGPLDPAVRRSLEYARSHDLATLEKGRHEADGGGLYFNVLEYATAPSEEKTFEAHRDYIDVHYMIRGEERIEVAFVSRMERGEYQPEGDYLAVAGTAAACVTLREGDFLVCYPEDGHKPGVQADAPMAVKKAVFKVAVRAAESGGSDCPEK